jgi:hypothetical protein
MCRKISHFLLCIGLLTKTADVGQVVKQTHVLGALAVPSVIKTSDFRDPMDEQVDLSDYHAQFEEQADREPVRNIHGKSAKVLTDYLDLPSYHFISPRQGFVIVIRVKYPFFMGFPHGQYEIFLEEAQYYEIKKIGWLEQGFSPREAHVIALAEQVERFSREGSLTWYHRRQLTEISVASLQSVVQENKRSQQWVLSVLQMANSKGAKININRIVEYRNRLRQVATWTLKYRDWRERYESKRREIPQKHPRNFTELEEDLSIVQQIREMAAKEVNEIRTVEDADEVTKEISHYPNVQARPDPWNAGLQRLAESAMSNDEHYEWNRYYYHGTSLGVAAVASTIGFLGGMPGLIRELDIDYIGSEERVYITPGSTANGYYGENIIGKSAEYATRQTRLARAVLAYYALRKAWESDGNLSQYLFPPFDYFLLRAIIRIPTASFELREYKEFYWKTENYFSYDPIPLDQADILIDPDIPWPRTEPEEDWGEGLSDTDPERRLDNNLFIGSFQKRYRRDEAKPYMGGIERAVQGKWRHMFSHGHVFFPLV